MTLSQRVLLLIIVIGTVLLALARFNSIPVGSFFDDAHYIVLAESMAEQRGYRLINYPHAPVEDAFPPGWPLLLTPLTAVAPGNLFLPRLLAFTFWMLSLWLVYHLFSQRLSTPYAEMATALVALNPHLIGMAGTAMSESSYLFFSLLTLTLWQKWRNEENKRPFWLLLCVVTAVFTMLIRTIGVAMLGAVLLSLLFTLRKTHLKTALAVLALLLLGLMALTLFNQQSGGTLIFSSLYADHVRYLLPRMGELARFWEHGAVISLETIANAVVPAFGLQFVEDVITPIGVQALSIGVLLLVLSGVMLTGRRRWQAQEWYLLFYALIFYVWSVYISEVQPRIAIPIIPFLIFYLVTAVVESARHFQQKAHAKQMALAVLGGLLLLSLARNGYVWLNPTSDRIVDLALGSSWLNENAAPDAIVMSPNPVPDYLYARRQTVNYPRQQEDVIAAVAAQNVDYILIRPALERSFDEDTLDAYTANLLYQLQSHPTRFREVFRQPQQQTWVFQVLND